MKTLKVFLYCLLCHLAASEVTTTINEKEVAPSLKTITSKDSESVAETKSQPTKRDSADQTATYVGKQQKEEPFKPIYRAPYQQEQQFRPTTVRYALAGAAPQAYYEKQELTGGIQYAESTKPTNDNGGILYATPSAAVNDNIINGIPYGANAYREAFFNPNYHQQHPQQPSHYAYASPSPQQVKASSVATEAAASPTSQHQQQQQQYYSHTDPEEQHFMYERMQQLLQQQQQRPHQPQQQQIRYIIAIPIEYARQLQQQFAHVPTHASQAFALQHQNVAYRPQIHYMAAAAAANNPPTETPAAHTVPTAYTMQVIKLPAGLLQSLESSIYQKPAVTVAPQQYQQPAPYYQHPQQQQQQTTFYYAYPYSQQHQPQHQHQQQQQRQQQQQQTMQQQAIVRIGSTKPSATVAPTSPTPTPASPVLATPSATPHFIQSKPIFLQQQHQQQQLQHHHHHHHQLQQQQKEAMSYAHYTQSHAPAPPYFIRQVFVAQPAHAAQNHAPAFVPLQPPLPGGMSTKLSYVYPYAAQMHQHQLHQHEAAAGLPYFRHPGAVHYGTHLYHPPTPLTPPNKDLGPVVATRQQQQPQQHQYQHPTAAGVSAAESGPTPSSVVKYP